VSLVAGSLVGGTLATSRWPPKGSIAATAGSDVGTHATCAVPAVPGGLQQPSIETPVAQVPCLTAGLPTPDAINVQKESYARSLEEQLKQGVELLGATHKQKTDYLHASANQQKHQYNLMLDQQVKQQEMVLSQHYNQQLMILQQAAQQQRAELEQQAASLTLEWRQKQTQEEFMREQLGIQQRYAQVQQELAVEMEKVGGVQGGSALLPMPAASPAVPNTPNVLIQGGSTLLPVPVASPATARTVSMPAGVASAPAVPMTVGRHPPSSVGSSASSFVAPGQLGTSRSLSYSPPAAVVANWVSYVPPA